MKNLSKILITLVLMVVFSSFGFGMVKGYGSSEPKSYDQRSTFETAWTNYQLNNNLTFNVDFSSDAFIDSLRNEFNRLRFAGVSDPFAVIELNMFSNRITKTTKADSAGRWEIIVDQTLAGGNHTVYITAKTVDGKVVRADKPYTISIDTQKKLVTKNDSVLLAADTTVSPLIVDDPASVMDDQVAVNQTGEVITTTEPVKKDETATVTDVKKEIAGAETKKESKKNNLIWYILGGAAVAGAGFYIAKNARKEK